MARLAGYAPGCSHVTGCQLLKKPKISATVRGLEEALAREMNMTKRRLIAEMVGSVELAKSLSEPSTMIAGLRQIALMAGYYRQEEVVRERLIDGQSVVQANFVAMTDADLVALIGQGNAGSH